MGLSRKSDNDTLDWMTVITIKWLSEYLTSIVTIKLTRMSGRGAGILWWSSRNLTQLKHWRTLCWEVNFNKVLVVNAKPLWWTFKPQQSALLNNQIAYNRLGNEILYCLRVGGQVNREFRVNLLMYNTLNTIVATGGSYKLQKEIKTN